jgi:hypothetical protein
MMTLTKTMTPARMSRRSGGPIRRALLACAVLGLVAAGPAARAEYPVTTLATLLDRAQIEDMLVEYYAKLGPGGSDFGSFYVEDGTLDVNGLMGRGKQGIEDVYRKVGQGSPKRPGTFRMLLTNPRIVVNGDTATADVIWTGINSDAVTTTPQLVEQGREHDELVKRNGRWYFKHRVITSDGGMQAMFVKPQMPK